MEVDPFNRANQIVVFLASYLTDLSFILQAIGLFCSIILALILYRFIIFYSGKMEYLFEEKRFLSFGYKSFRRILFPLILFIVLLAVGGMFAKIKLENGLIQVIAPLIFSLVIIRLSVYLLRKVVRPGPALKAFENLISGAIWVVVVLYLLGWLGDVAEFLDTIAIQMGEGRLSILSLLKFILAASIFSLLALYLSSVAEKKLSAAQTLPANVRVGVAKVSKLVFYVLAILFALNSVGFDLTIFTVFGGALGVGVGFGLQRIASNYISGFILIMDRSIKPGDVISTGNSFGWVESLKGRYIVVKDRDGVETLIPNETLVTTQVVNWSYGDKKIRVKVPIQVSYGDDPRKCIALMLESAFASRRVLNEPAPTCRLIEFGDSGITLELRVWINDPENGMEEVRTDIYLAIWDRFKEENITIPFPQRDIHIHKTQVDSRT